MPNVNNLRGYLKENNIDGFLRYGITYEDSNLFYLTGIKIPDPATYLQTQEESILMVNRSLELNRARENAEVDLVKSSNEYVPPDEEDDSVALIKLLKEKNVQKLAVLEDFQLGLAEKLEREGIELEVIDDLVMESRVQKSEEEIQKIKEIQAINEEAMIELENTLKTSKIEGDSIYLDGEILTTERLKSRIEKFLLDKECRNPNGMIITSGKASADPHKRDSGEIKPNEPIIADIFPEHRSKYFGDMTRTFVKGEASQEVRKMKKDVEAAFKAALEVLENGAGTKASEVHEAASKVLEDRGHPTLKTGAETEGFIHSTGHAVGLDLHEPPRIKFGEQELKSGMILTIEPGLYYPETGGVRLEDMILVKDDGYENLNSMHKDMEID